MKPFLRRVALLAILALAVSLTGSNAGAGHLSTTETWTAAESPYVLSEDRVIESDTRLVIEPGVEVRAARGVHLIIEGQLDVQGTPDSPVTFTVQESIDERWGGIVVRSPDFFHHSTITGAVIDRAVTGLSIERANVEVNDSTFHTNLTGIRFVNPVTDIAVQGSVFENNTTAVTGYTRNVITLFQNDFWNNPTTLLPKPEPKHDCGSDAGVWNIHSNDILRGPANAGYFSNDVRTPPGSAPSDYRVLASGNWWGTSDPQRVPGRMTTDFDCCPTPAEQQIAWDPIATEPQTEYEPQGENPDPEPSFGGHGDPGVVTDFEKPEHGTCLDAASFDSFKGDFGGGLGGPMKVTAALRLKRGSRCRWWNEKRARLVAGPCKEMKWFRVRVHEGADRSTWSYRFSSDFPAGRYMAWSYGFAEPTHLGRNQIAFRLR